MCLPQWPRLRNWSHLEQDREDSEELTGLPVSGGLIIKKGGVGGVSEQVSVTRNNAHGQRETRVSGTFPALRRVFGRNNHQHNNNKTNNSNNNNNTNNNNNNNNNVILIS